MYDICCLSILYFRMKVTSGFRFAFTKIMFRLNPVSPSPKIVFSSISKSPFSLRYECACICSEWLQWRFIFNLFNKYSLYECRSISLEFQRFNTKHRFCGSHSNFEHQQPLNVSITQAKRQHIYTGFTQFKLSPTPYRGQCSTLRWRKCSQATIQGTLFILSFSLEMIRT